MHDDVVATPWGDVPAPPATPAGPATLVLRPDAVRVDTNGQIRASVVRTRFAGAHVDLVAQPERGPELAVSVPTRDAPAPGARVALGFDPDALLVYPRRLNRVPSRKVEEAANELARRDRVMKRMLRAHGVPDLSRAKPARSHFPELARAICFQQLAGRAAQTIHGRFVALVDGDVTPDAVLALTVEQMRSAGLSGAKTASIRDLAEKVLAGLVELDRMNRLPDDQVVRELTLVRGIGEWTAHMFLMFQLGRLDVWPIGDLGVRAGYARMHGREVPPTPKELEPEGERFRPFRSVVACWCWREVDVVTPS